MNKKPEDRPLTLRGHTPDTPHDHADPSSMRKVYFDAWQKHLSHNILSPMEAIIVDLIEQHPEYHPLFATEDNYESCANEKFDVDHNPFFHLGLHIAIKEQVMTDRPFGIRALYQQLCMQYGGEINAEHQIMPCLREIMREQIQTFDNHYEAQYLNMIRALVRL